MKSNRLFVFSESRSGSNWLIESLSSHHDIDLRKELFQPKKIQKYLTDDNKNSLKVEFDYIESHFVDSESTYCGCKILFPQAIRFMDFYSFIDRYTDAYFISLTRNNSIEAEVSDLIAQKYGKWHCRQAADCALYKIQLDPEYFYQRLQWRILAREFIVNMLKSYQINLLELTYETLFIDQDLTISQILNFLKIDQSNMKLSNEIKANPFSLRDIISNYDEVFQYLNKMNIRV